VLENLNNTTCKKYTAAAVFLSFLLTVSLSAGDITAPVYIVADADNGDILLEKGADIPIPPASLAKIMTLNLSLKDVESGRLSYSGLYGIPAGGTAAGMRPGSSILGLSSGDESTLITLQRAAAMVSANDAAWTLALLSNGDEKSFVQRMNREAAALGMGNTLYTDPDGWSSLSVTSGRDQMKLVLYYLKHHPDVLEMLHALPWMVYQDEDRLAREPQKRNTNLLLERMDGVDGLKTGTIPSSGFHFIATAEREGTRFIALVMGIRAGSYAESLNRRAEEAGDLLNWAFSNYYSWRPRAIQRIRIPVRHGDMQTVSLEVSMNDLEEIEAVTLKKRNSETLSIMVERPEALTAPLGKGDAVGTVRWYTGSRLLAECPLRVERSVGKHWRLKDIF